MYVRTLRIGISRGTLVDLETTGLDSFNDEIITTGVVTANKIRILQRKDRNKARFYSKAVKFLRACPRPFYAYNAGFEADFMRRQCGLKIRFVDLFEPWRIRANQERIKWPQLDELVKEPDAYFGEAVVKATEIPALWGSYLREPDTSKLDLILRHNESDLLRELYLLVHYPFLSRPKHR